jgi:hypothetical protein
MFSRFTGGCPLVTVSKVKIAALGLLKSITLKSIGNFKSRSLIYIKSQQKALKNLENLSRHAKRTDFFMQAFEKIPLVDLSHKVFTYVEYRAV